MDLDSLHQYYITLSAMRKYGRFGKPRKHYGVFIFPIKSIMDLMSIYFFDKPVTEVVANDELMIKESYYDWDEMSLCETAYMVKGLDHRMWIYFIDGFDVVICIMNFNGELCLTWDKLMCYIKKNNIDATILEKPSNILAQLN